MNYALVEAGVVVNVIVLNETNHSDFPNAIALIDVPAGIGDTYVDGTFYRDGVDVLTIASSEEPELD